MEVSDWQDSSLSVFIRREVLNHRASFKLDLISKTGDVSGFLEDSSKFTPSLPYGRITLNDVVPLSPRPVHCLIYPLLRSTMIHFLHYSKYPL